MNSLSPWVAIVDDDESICRALQRLLRAADIEATAFSSGAAFLGLAATNPPQCIVLDLHMPDISGFDMQCWLAEHAPDIQVIVMTGQDSAETERRVMAYQPLAYLLKPMSDELLLAAVELALRKRIAARQPGIRDFDGV